MSGFIDRNDRPFDLVAKPGIVIVPLGQVLALGAHLGDQLAIVADLDLSQFIRFFGNQIGEFPDHVSAGCRRKRRPFALVERLVGSFDGAVDIVGIAFRHQGPRLSGIRIEGFECFARCRVHPFAAYEHLVLGKCLNTGIHDRPFPV